MFTTLRVYQQSLDSALTNWKEHCDRLHITLQTFEWQQPQWDRIRQGAEILITRFPVLRITLFPDGREWITGRNIPPNLTERQHYGIAVWLAAAEEFQRCLPEYKTGNYLSAWMAKNTAQNLGSGEAILVDANGNWLETSTGNLWGWQNNCWWTPPLEAGILPGVVRQQLINWCQNHNDRVREEPWSPQIVKRFEAIAYTNSIVEVIPIHTVMERQGERTLSYDPYHPAFQLLRSLFAKSNNE